MGREKLQFTSGQLVGLDKSVSISPPSPFGEREGGVQSNDQFSKITGKTMNSELMITEAKVTVEFGHFVG